MADLATLLGRPLAHQIVFYGVSIVMAGVVGVWGYALYRTVRRVVVDISPRKERPSLERIREYDVLAVRTSWLEAHSIPVFALVSMAIIWMFIGRFQILGLFGFFAPSIVSLISIFLIWLHYHLGKLQLTDKRAIKYGGLFADHPVAIRLQDITSVQLESNTWWERKFQLPTILIEGSGSEMQITLKKVSDAKRFQAILLMLKKKDELGLPMHAPLPADIAEEELRNWNL